MRYSSIGRWQMERSPAPAFFDRNCPQQWKEPKPRRSTRKRDLCSFIRSFGDRIPDGYLERERNRKWQHQTWISPHHFDKAGRGTVQYSSDIPPTGQQPLICGRPVNNARTGQDRTGQDRTGQDKTKTKTGTTASTGTARCMCLARGSDSDSDINSGRQ